MTTTARILKPALADYAKELLAAGYKVYLPASDVKRVANGGMEAVGNWFRFSRVVDGKTCHASVAGNFSWFEFSMPIKPSREHGSSMFVGRASEYGEDLTVENAELYASPSNWNPIVGTHNNYEDPRWSHLYEEVSA